MARILLLISLLGAGLAFSAAFETLALLGLGVPMLLGALITAASAGLVLHAALDWKVERPMAALQSQLLAMQASNGNADAGAQAHIAEVEARAATLRHDLRGVLSPALMVTDRLLSNPDPAIQRAGQAVVRSVDRATALIQASKEGGAAKEGAATAAGAAPADPAAR